MPSPSLSFVAPFGQSVGRRARDVRALVVDVGDAVLVVIGIGAAIGVLEAVEVFRIVRALVDVVLDAIAVAVADVRLEHDADEAAQIGICTLAVIEAGAAAERQERVAREVQLDAGDRLERLIIDVVAERLGAVDLADTSNFWTAIAYDRPTPNGISLPPVVIVPPVGIIGPFGTPLSVNVSLELSRMPALMPTLN